MYPFGSDSSSTTSFEHRISQRARRLSLRVTPKGVVVVTPPRTPQFLIQQFVDAHQDWIQTQQQKLAAQQLDDSVVMIFGIQYPKQLGYKPELPLGISIHQQSVFANLPEAHGGKKEWGSAQEKQLLRFLKAAAITYITERTRTVAEKMKTRYAHLTLREQSSRWGSCSSQGNLNFNWRLVHAPTPVIDYVIIHELAHRTHMDHSRRFWNLVAEYDPAYLEHRGWLKRHGQGMMAENM